jgi:hypothetical protein
MKVKVYYICECKERNYIVYRTDGIFHIDVKKHIIKGNYNESDTYQLKLECAFEGDEQQPFVQRSFEPSSSRLEIGT